MASEHDTDASDDASRTSGYWWARLRAAVESTLTLSGLDDLSYQIVELLRQGMRAETASILVAEAGSQEFSPRALSGLDARTSVLLLEFVAEREATGRVERASTMLTGARAVTVNDLDPPSGADEAGLAGLRSVVVAPIVVGDDVRGVVHVASPRPGHFDEIDGEVLTLVAEQLASVMGRVRLFEAERASRAEALLAAERLSRLQRITEALSGALDVDGVADVVLGELADGLGRHTRHQSLWVVEGFNLRLVRGWPRMESLGDEFEIFGLDATLPASEAVRTGQAVWIYSREEAVARYPLVRGLPLAASYAVLPLVSNDRALGVLALGFDSAERMSEDLRGFLGAVAAQCAQAIQRAILFKRERGQRERFELLADLTRLLSSSLDPDEIVDQLVDMVAGRLSEACVVMVPTPGGLHRKVARTKGVLSESVISLVTRLEDVPYDADAPSAAAFRTGTVQWAELGPDLAEAANVSPEVMAGFEGRATGLAVPITARGEALGVMLFIMPGPGLPLSPDEVSLATEVAARAGVAIDNANRYRHQHDMAEVLQRAILPERLPELEGVALDAVYRAGMAGTYAGGDWYDAFVLSRGQVFLSVGDVMGKGPAAAALMGQLRSAVRVHAIATRSPASVLAGLDRFFEELREERLASVVAALFDVPSGLLTIASAGHPAPLLLRGDGTTEALRGGHSVILGPRLVYSPRVERTWQLSRGDSVIFYSDGLVERRGEVITAGVDRLAEAVSWSETKVAAAAPTAGSVVEALLPASPPSDDVVVLTLRATGVAPRPRPRGSALGRAASEATLALEPHPASTTVARHWVAEQLRDLPVDVAETASLLTSEVVTNAVLHAATMLTVSLTRRGRLVRVAVDDQNPALPAVRHVALDAVTGRGLYLVETLAARWGTRSTSTGKEVWFELDTDAGWDTWEEKRQRVRGPRTEAVTGARRRGIPRRDEDPVEVDLLDVPVDGLLAVVRRHEQLLSELRAMTREHGELLGAVPGRLLPAVDQLAKGMAPYTVVPRGELRQAVHRDQRTVDLHYRVPGDLASLFEQADALLDEADDYCKTHRLHRLAPSPSEVGVRKWILWEFVRQCRGLGATRWDDSPWRATAE